jgi:site-specific DNA-cytosine methylase
VVDQRGQTQRPSAEVNFRAISKYVSGRTQHDPFCPEIATVGNRQWKDKPFLLVYYGSDGGGGWQRLNRPLRTITTVDRFALVKPDPHHGHVMRMLQVPELQAAMGMPSTMSFKTGSRRERIKMIGNAVCPPVMKDVVRHLTSISN